MPNEIKKVLIIGGGFGGIAVALALEKKNLQNISITLVSDKSHFEYKSALYRVVTGRSPLEVCMPIQEILNDKNVSFAIDKITNIDLKQKKAIGELGFEYDFDYCVLALGSETSYFNIPGLEEFSFGFKSIPEAMQLKEHLNSLFRECKNVSIDPNEKVCLLQVVIVGAGPSGVELAGELAQYMNKLAQEFLVEQSLIAVELIEAESRILPTLPESMSKKTAQRLKNLGVNIYTNRPITRSDIEQITVRGMTMRTETVIWTAGIMPNRLYQNIEGLILDNKGRVVVDEYMRAKGQESVFAIGDGASTLKSGMAQTAIYDGEEVARNIARSILGKSLKSYKQKTVYYALPVGSGWAVVLLGSVVVSGTLGWIIRRFADIRYFLSILPFRKALRVFIAGKKLCDSCGICKPNS